ncbi:MAG: NAD(P)/FAD-dependent oxidoreductase [Chloroflexota bacterium]
MTASGLSSGARVVVVGAGLSGLICARQLIRAGLQVTLFEKANEVGGRLQTEVTPDGYVIDRGFQVLFAAYPALRRHVHLEGLEPQYLASGVEISYGERCVTLGHPAFDAAALLKTLGSGKVEGSDIGVLAQVLTRSLSLGDAPLSADDVNVRKAVSTWGLSQRFSEDVIFPLFRGVSLDRSVASDASFLRFVLRNMSVGRVFLPAQGIQALPKYLMARLPADCVKFGTRVDAVLQDQQRVTGIRTSVGDIEAQCVVVATEAPTAAALVGVSLPAVPRMCTTAYFSSGRPLYKHRRLLLNGTDSLVTHVMQLTNVARQYAPIGCHLLAASVPEYLDGSDDDVTSDILHDLRSWYAPARTWVCETIVVKKVAFAQFAQLPGVYRDLPPTFTPVHGLFLAGEYLHSSSVQGAIRGGELAAQEVIRHASN